MPTANSLAGLKAMIAAEVQEAMQESMNDAMNDMREGIEYFYSGGTPKIYMRTHLLESTPKTEGVSGGGNVFTFDAYLNQGLGYSSGDSPSMGQVLDLANYGIQWRTRGGGLAKPTVGSKGFWEQTETFIKQDVIKNFSAHFG